MAERYDAFISYSHDDAEVAARLAQRLRTYRPPRGVAVSRRKLRVFRDVERLTTHPSLDDALTERIRAADHLVLLASPSSAASVYVDKEVATFLERADRTKLIIALVGGNPGVYRHAELVDRLPMRLDIARRQ